MSDPYTWVCSYPLSKEAILPLAPGAQGVHLYITKFTSIKRMIKIHEKSHIMMKETSQLILVKENILIVK